MKNHIFFALLLASAISSQAQTAALFATNSGQTDFFSETPVENITAVNKSGQCIINSSTSEIVVRMSIKQFDFPNKLMQEHFNENYLESEKYPTATFKGKLKEKVDFEKDGVYDITATGLFNIHNVSKERTLKGKLEVSKGQATLNTDFDVALVDHKIEVPRLVFMKVAQVVRVKNRYVLTPYQPKKM